MGVSLTKTNADITSRIRHFKVAKLRQVEVVEQVMGRI